MCRCCGSFTRIEGFQGSDVASSALADLFVRLPKPWPAPATSRGPKQTLDLALQNRAQAAVWKGNQSHHHRTANCTTGQEIDQEKNPCPDTHLNLCGAVARRPALGLDVALGEAAWTGATLGLPPMTDTVLEEAKLCKIVRLRLCVSSAVASGCGFGR